MRLPTDATSGYGFYGIHVVQYVTVRNVLLAGAAVFVIVTLTLANVTAAAAVTVMVALTDTLLFGKFL